MIRAILTGKDGTTVVFLGISGKNVEKLKEDRPIIVKGNEMGLGDIDIMIAYEETEEQMLAKLQQFIGPDTVVHDRRSDRDDHLT